MQPIEPDEALIRPLAAKYAGRFRMVDRDDIAQEMRVWWLRNQRRIKKLIDDERQDKIYDDLRQVSRRYCERQKAQTAGYEVGDLHWYDAGVVRELLPMVWDTSLLTQDQAPDDGARPRNRKPANEGGNLMAMVSDCSRAVAQVDLDEYAMLWLQFGPMKYSNQDLAVYLDTSLAAAKMRVQRALNRLVDLLGGDSPFHTSGPGRRRAESNAAAQARTRNEYAED